MTDKLSGNIVAELRKRGTLGGLSDLRMKLALEGMWNKVEYALKDTKNGR